MSIQCLTGASCPGPHAAILMWVPLPRLKLNLPTTKLLVSAKEQAPRLYSCSRLLQVCRAVIITILFVLVTSEPTTYPQPRATSSS